jgi:hypothetical protein
MSTPTRSAGPAYCTACGAETKGRFCPRCGTPAGAVPPRSSDRTTWIISGIVVVLSLAAILYAVNRPSAVSPGAPLAASGAFAGPAPDISNISAREGFDRLFNRVMTAAESGDTATVLQYTAHALGAYAQLDSVDADARYHAAVMLAQVGQFPEALALADTILATTPQHLLAFVIRGTVAELTRDQAALDRARTDFLAAWAADPKRDRQEYLDHQAVLDGFHTAAEAARTKAR